MRRRHECRSSFRTRKSRIDAPGLATSQLLIACSGGPLDANNKEIQVMRIVKMLGIALAAILALGVVAAAGASANEWLLNGKVLTEELVVPSKGTLRLTDSKTTVGSVSVECTVHDEETFGPGKSGKVTKVTGPSGELALSCATVSGTCSSPNSTSTLRRYCSIVRIIRAPAEDASRPDRATESSARGIFSRR